MDLNDIKKTKTFHTLIMNTEKILYEGEVKYVSSKNEKAKFDILPGHTNFISIIKEYLTVVKPDESKLEFKVDHGIIMCYESNLKVYLGITQSI